MTPALIKRVVSASGPMTGAELGECIKLSPWYATHESNDPLWTDFVRAIQDGSLDAAVSLCARVMKTHPHGPLWTRRHDIRCDNKAEPFCFVEITVPSREYQGQHRSEPLALVLAVLRAVGEGK